MSNPILTSELYQDDGALKKLLKDLQNVRGEYLGLIEDTQAYAVKVESSFKKANVSNTSQRAGLKETIEQVDKLQKEYDKYVSLLDESNIQIAAVKRAQQELNKVNKLEGTIRATQNGSIENLNAQYKLNKKRLEQLTEAQKENTKEGYKLNEQTVRQAARIKALKDEQRQAIKIRELENKVAKSQEGSYNRLSAQYSLMKIRLNAMGEEQRFNTKEGKEMQMQSEAIYKEMDRLQRLTGKHTLNVGNYTNSIIAAFQRQKELAEQLEKTKQQYQDLPKEVRETEKAQQELAESTKAITDEMSDLSAITGKTSEDFEKGGKSMLDSISDLPGALGDAGSGVQGLSRNFKALLANPVVLTLGLIVGGLAALFTAFTKTERGTKIITKATGLLNGIWSETIGVVDSLAGFIEKVFTDPRQALEDFGNLLQRQITNRFLAILDIAGAVGKGLKALWERDLQGVKDAASDAGTALIQFTTGLDSDAQTEFSEALKETTANVEKQIKGFVDLATAKRSVAAANRTLTKQAEDLRTEEELLLQVADDSTKSFKAQEEAAEAAAKKIQERAKLEIQIAKNNLGLINTEIDLRKANGEQIDALLDQQVQAYRDVANAERELSLATAENEKTRAQLKQDRLERDLDILLDGFENQRSINDRIIKDDSRTFEERQKLQDETVRLSNDSFDKQIETIQKFTGANVDANDLINESDAVVLNQKIRNLGLSEIIEGRLLEIVRDRKTALLDLNETQKGLDAGRAKASEKELEIARKLEEDKFKQQQEFQQSEFDLQENTERDKTRFRIKAEIDRLKKVLEINKKFAGDLTQLQKDTLNNQIQALQNELTDLNQAKDQDIYSVFGLNLSDEKKEAIKNSFEFAKGQLFEFAATRTEIANQNVEQANQEVNAAEQALQREIQNRRDGFASNVEAAQQQLALEKETQKKALDERAKAQRQEILLQSAAQAANLVTASTKIWGQLGFPAAIPAVGIMWGSFLASKIRAVQLTKKQFAEGGLVEVAGGSHASGNDTPLGFEVGGKQAYAERGEFHMILKKARSRQYKTLMPEIFKSLDRGTFETDFMNMNHSTTGIPIFGQVSTTDMSKTETELTRIRKQGEQKEQVLADGTRIIKRGNHTIRIHGSK